MLLLFAGGGARPGLRRGRSQVPLVKMFLLVVAGVAALFCYRAAKHCSKMSGHDDPLLSLRGSGTRLWGNEHADDYVSRLRQSRG